MCSYVCETSFMIDKQFNFFTEEKILYLLKIVSPKIYYKQDL